MPQDLPGAPALLKQLLEQILSERESDKGKFVILKKRTLCCVSAFLGASHCLPIFHVSKSFHERSDHELTCACGFRKDSIGEEIREQLEIVSMQAA